MKKVSLVTVLLVIASGCGIGRRAYLSATHRVVRNVTEGMMPAVKPGDYLVIDRTYYSTNRVRRFDIIIVKSPRMISDTNGTDLFVVKRVIALGGEKVEIRRGRLYINGEELKESFTAVPHETSEEFPPFVIPSGEYFLLGDNRPNSEDSRHWERHSVDKSYIVAKVTEIIPSHELPKNPPT